MITHTCQSRDKCTETKYLEKKFNKQIIGPLFPCLTLVASHLYLPYGKHLKLNLH